MELCEGGSAIDLCQICQTTLKAEECSALCASVLLGLKFLHEKLGIVHRDVKGKNVLLTRDGRVKLTDLGIAIESPEKNGGPEPAPAGSPHWMAPELTSKSLTRYANDIWSLGITLIELVEGEPPHSQIDPMEVLQVIDKSPAPELSKATQKIAGSHLVSFLSNCVIKDPKKRPNAAQLLKHPFVDSFVMHYMVSDKAEPSIKALMDRAFPVIIEYKEYESSIRLQQQEQPQTQQQPSPPQQQEQPQTVKASSPRSPPVDPPKPKPQSNSIVSNGKKAESPGEVKPKSKPKFSEAEGDLVVLKFSEAEGDLFILDADEYHAERDRESSNYEQSVEELNATRFRKRPESIRAMEILVRGRKSTITRKSDDVRDSEQVKAMQARMTNLQTKMDKDVSKMKRWLPKGIF